MTSCEDGNARVDVRKWEESNDNPLTLLEKLQMLLAASSKDTGTGCSDFVMDDASTELEVGTVDLVGVRFSGDLTGIFNDGRVGVFSGICLCLPYMWVV